MVFSKRQGVNMQDLLTLYQYIKDKYNNYQAIKYTTTEITIVFYKGFEMKIQLKGFYNIYLNDMFYYNVDWQDIKDTIDDFLTNKYVFCEQNNKLKVTRIENYRENTKYNHIWTIEKVLK